MLPGSLSLCAFFLLTVLVPDSHAQDRTDEAGEASISDPSVECTAYYYAPSATQIHSFPTVWQPASILANDTTAQAKWQSIMGSIPTTILPKGTSTGNFTNVTYSASDPDCWWSYHQCVQPKLAGLPADIASVPEPGTLGFGFDDGPNCSHNAFYDYLTSQNQKATMFYIGSNVMDWPLEAQRAVADGHEICVHTWSHRYSTYPRMQAIKLVTGVTPKCWRPPFGDVDDRIRAIANALGLQTIIWKYDSNDWKAGTGNITTETVDANYQALINNMTSGAFSTQGTIMLTHELNNYTMSTAMKWYPQLKAAFQYLVPIAVAMNNTQPYVETNYSFPTFDQYVAGQTNTSVTTPAKSGGVVVSWSCSLALLGVVLTVLRMM
ncbi:carbohydrate esterase family 4 protein [Armillaria gallica]|uniref:chitin deacetylase n=1 Tax=Armillaria gallica TaxID=47427 RepID=A0A2H3CVA9_ARMGA|nr:carbohydrate esterase family 4 protein [Armillaria gallica]